MPASGPASGGGLGPGLTPRSTARQGPETGPGLETGLGAGPGPEAGAAMRARPGLNRTSSMLTQTGRVSGDSVGEHDESSEGSGGTGRSQGASRDLDPADWEGTGEGGEGGSEDGRAAVGATRGAGRAGGGGRGGGGRGGGVGGARGGGALVSELSVLDEQVALLASKTLLDSQTTAAEIHSAQEIWRAKMANAKGQGQRMSAPPPEGAERAMTTGSIHVS